MIARQTSDFGLDVTVDRYDGGIYTEGDSLAVRVTCERSGFLYLLYLDSRGNPSLLFPQMGEDNRIRPNQERMIPSDKRYRIQVKPPYGTARIKAVVCSRPLQMTGLIPSKPRPQQADSVEEQDAEHPKLATLQKFRWHPSQRRLIVRLLHHYQQAKSLDAVEYGELKPREFLGDFAQDEVAFYIGPKRGE